MKFISTRDASLPVSPQGKDLQKIKTKICILIFANLCGRCRSLRKQLITVFRAKTEGCA